MRTTGWKLKPLHVSHSSLRDRDPETFVLPLPPVFVMALLHPPLLNELTFMSISSCVQGQLIRAQAHPLAQLHHPLLGSE